MFQVSTWWPLLSLHVIEHFTITQIHTQREHLGCSQTIKVRLEFLCLNKKKSILCICGYNRKNWRKLTQNVYFIYSIWNNFLLYPNFFVNLSPFWLQNNKGKHVQVRCVQNCKVSSLYSLKNWKMFLLVSITVVYGGPEVHITPTNQPMQKHIKDLNNNLKSKTNI